MTRRGHEMNRFAIYWACHPGCGHRFPAYFDVVKRLLCVGCRPQATDRLFEGLRFWLLFCCDFLMSSEAHFRAGSLNVRFIRGEGDEYQRERARR
jgi:hypothetical protein